jgi:hypothetical protein
MRAAFAKEVDEFTSRQESVLAILNSRTHELDLKQMADRKGHEKAEADTKQRLRDIERQLASLAELDRNGASPPGKDVEVVLQMQPLETDLCNLKVHVNKAI